MKTNPRSPALQAELDNLAKLPDEDIDTVDIPEAPTENWRQAVRPARQHTSAFGPTSPPVLI